MNKVEINSISNKSYYVSEAFKSLRTNLQFCGANIQCVMITSCIPNEGKSVTTVELAKTLSELGKRVLFIDADMRKSVLATRYQLEAGAKGLSQYLTAQATLDEIIYETQYPGLNMIFSGIFPPNPVELLYGKRFAVLIEKMRERYDYIIIDTPPLACVTDAAVISTYCDGSILVVAAEKVSSRVALSVKEQLEKSDCKLLGAIINHVDQKSRSRKLYGEYGTKYSKGYYYSKSQPKNTDEIVSISDIPEDTEIAGKPNGKQEKQERAEADVPGVSPLMSTKKPYSRKKN